MAKTATDPTHTKCVVGPPKEGDDPIDGATLPRSSWVLSRLALAILVIARRGCLIAWKITI